MLADSHRILEERLAGGYVTAAEMMSAYRRAKIGWNFHLSVGPNNSRLTALPAFGILQICDNKANLGKIFKLDEEVVGFDTLEECLEKTRYYLDHPREARAIAAHGWKRRGLIHEVRGGAYLADIRNIAGRTG